MFNKNGNAYTIHIDSRNINKVVLNKMSKSR